MGYSGTVVGLLQCLEALCVVEACLHPVRGGLEAHVDLVKEIRR
jgi:hypothetical protein